MHLPAYFLADLPPEATLTSGMLAEAAQTLKRNRELYLRDRSTPSLVRTIAELASSWVDPEFRFRKFALAAAERTGFAASTLAAGLDLFFRQLTAENLESLLLQEFGHVRRLDDLSTTALERAAERGAVATGPEFIVHIAAGNIPNPTLLSMIFGLLVRSAQFVKCASSSAFLPRLFAHSLYEIEPKLGACLELAAWPGGQNELESALFNEADAVTATGGDEALAAIRQNVSVKTRFLGYGHRLSFGYITAEALAGSNPGRLADQAGLDVAAWDQLGCLSPHVFYVERRGRVSPETFAELLAASLARLEATQPRGPLPESVAAAIANRRAFYQLREAHSADTRQWASPGSTAWTVVLESDAQFQTSCLHRFVYVKPVADLTQALQGADAFRRHISTVGLAAPEDRQKEITLALARWGATRVCPIGRMQNPPLSWRHDGRPAMSELVTWTDWEYPS